MKDNQFKSLLKKTQAKAAQVKKPTKQAYDPTLAATRGNDQADDSEAKEIFKEMKRREF
ncbi:hypothetical protein [Gemmatimonas sp.]|jgi:hypothetical protein|uniref:hypothetical protein n=1 Tax=Gemmatimonas sp. TaxID=1962908 RepID=UPI00260C3FD6|nr:hypothetical protein [Gemmatimonas sp.]